MASGTIAIAGLQLGDLKRSFRVKANRKTAKAGDVITFTITATGVADRTVRSYYITGVEPIDLTGGKTNGLFYLRQGKAEVFVQIAEDYDRDKDQELVFNVIDSKSALFKIKRPPQAKVTIKGDGESTGEEQRKRLRESRENKRLRGRNSKSLPPSKGGLARQDPIYPVNVREVAPKALKYGAKALPGMRQRGLPPGAPRGLPASSAPRALPPAGMKSLPASQQIVNITPVSKSVTPMGGALAKGGTAAGGGALAKGGAGALKGVKAGGAASLLTAGLEFGSRMDSGQNVVQAGVGTAASTAGGIVGASKGAAVGAALGSVVPGLGTAIGGLLGAVIGGVGGSMLAGGAADAITGANRQQFNEGAHFLPKMTDMPFNLPGLSGSFNEPGNPEVMSITPLDNPLKALQSISGIASMVPGLGGIGAMGSMLGGMGGLFGGKPKEYEGIATAIADEMDDRGFGDPLGIQGKGKNKSFGNMTRDMLGSAMGDMLKEIFGGLFGGNNSNTGTNTGSNTSGPSGTVTGGNEDNMLAAYLSTLEGGSGQNAADAMQVMLNRAAQNHSGYGTNVGDQAMAEAQFTPFSAAIYGAGLDPAANAAYGHIAPSLGRNPEERKAKLREIVRTEGFAGLDRIFNKNKAQHASAVLQDFQQGGPMSQLARQDVQGRAYFKGQSDIQNMKAGDLYRGTGGNYFHDDRNLSTLAVGTLQNVAPTGALNSPTLTPAPGAAGGGQTIVLAGGTNTAMDPRQAAEDMTAAMRSLKAQGHTVVVVPPNKDRWSSAYAAIKNSAEQEGLEVITATYDRHDPDHLSSQAITSIRSKYPNAVFMGDSNAVRLNGNITQSGVNRVGAQTSEIKDQAFNFTRRPQQRAAAAAAPRQTQLNPGFQQMSYNNTRGSGQVQAASPYAPTAASEGVLMGPGTFIQGNTGRSDGDHFHIGPELELWHKPAGLTEARRAAFKVAKGLIAKKETFWFTNAGIQIDGNNPPDDQTLMQYVEREQAAHAARSGGGSFGGLDIAGRDGLTMPLGVSDVRDRGDGFGISGTISGTRAFVGHGRAGSTSTPGTATMMAGQSQNGTMLASNNTQGPPPGNPEDFFAFAMGAQGLEYAPPPGASTTPDNLLATSASTSVNSASRPVTVVNSPVSTTNSVSGDSGGGGYASVAGGAMSDAGLLAYLAKQRLLTLGA